MGGGEAEAAPAARHESVGGRWDGKGLEVVARKAVTLEDKKMKQGKASWQASLASWSCRLCRLPMVAWQAVILHAANRAHTHTQSSTHHPPHPTPS